MLSNYLFLFFNFMVSGSQLTLNATAGANFTSADQYKCVKVDSSSTDAKLMVDLCGANASGIGFLLSDSGTDGETSVSVAFAGVAKAMAGAAISLGAFCKTDASGKLTPVTSNNDIIVAQALSAATADGDIIRVLVRSSYYGA